MRRTEILMLIGGACLCGAIGFGGCSSESKYAVVVDGSISSRNPPFLNDRSFVVTAVDGNSFQRERMRLFEDMYPGVLVEPGTHVFKLNVEMVPHSPPIPPPNEPPYQTSFTATVLAGHKYFIASDKGLPELVEPR